MKEEIKISLELEKQLKDARLAIVPAMEYLEYTTWWYLKLEQHPDILKKYKEFLAFLEQYTEAEYPEETDG
jgi:hypothetical protein